MIWLWNAPIASPFSSRQNNSWGLWDWCLGKSEVKDEGRGFNGRSGVCECAVFPSQEKTVTVCLCVFRNFVKTGCSVCEFQAKYCCGLFWKLRSDMAAKHFYNSDRRFVSMSMCISSENVLFHYCDYLCFIRVPRCYCNSCLHIKHTHFSSFHSLCLSY